MAKRTAKRSAEEELFSAATFKVTPELAGQLLLVRKLREEKQLLVQRRGQSEGELSFCGVSVSAGTSEHLAKYNSRHFAEKTGRPVPSLVIGAAAEAAKRAVSPLERMSLSK